MIVITVLCYKHIAGNFGRKLNFQSTLRLATAICMLKFAYISCSHIIWPSMTISTILCTRLFWVKVTTTMIYWSYKFEGSPILKFCSEHNETLLCRYATMAMVLYRGRSTSMRNVASYIHSWLLLDNSVSFNILEQWHSQSSVWLSWLGVWLNLMPQVTTYHTCDLPNSCAYSYATGYKADLGK